MKIIIGIFSFIFGACIASFCGVVSSRVPKGESINRPASHCVACNHKLSWYENIPILSYIFLGGKCKNCKAKIPIFYFLLEVIGGLSFLALYLVFGFTLEYFIGILLTILFLIIAGIDYDTHDIYDITTIIFGVISIIYVVTKSILTKTVPYNEFIGAVGGFIVFYLIRFISMRVYKQEALGLGDVLLVLVAGFLLGYLKLILAILFASLLASILELSLIALKKKNRESEIAFGPYLLFGFGFSFIFGDLIFNLLLL